MKKRMKKSEFFSPSQAKAFAEKYRKNFTKVNKKANNAQIGGNAFLYFPTPVFSFVEDYKGGLIFDDGKDTTTSSYLGNRIMRGDWTLLCHFPILDANNSPLLLDLLKWIKDNLKNNREDFGLSVIDASKDNPFNSIILNSPITEAQKKSFIEKCETIKDKVFSEKYSENLLHTYKEMHTYKEIKGNSIYNGMPEFSEDFNPYHEDFPLYCTLLLKIASIPMHQIIWGKTERNGKLIKQDFRQYEFQLSGDVADGWGVMHLFIKDKNHFFNEQETFKGVQGWQKIPLTYETMSKMSQEELTTIYFDFD